MKDLLAIFCVFTMLISLTCVGLAGSMKSDHDDWENARTFCSSNHGFYTNTTVGALIECRDLHDHHVFYMNTNTDQRFDETARR